MVAQYKSYLLIERDIGLEKATFCPWFSKKIAE